VNFTLTTHRQLGIKPLFVFNGITPLCIQELLLERYEKHELTKSTSDTFQTFNEELNRDFVIIHIIK